MPYGLSCSIECMSSPAADFVESWIDQNVTYVEKGGDSVGATTLADMCREAASVIGVSISDIKPEFGTLETIILEAMHHAIGMPDD